MSTATLTRPQTDGVNASGPYGRRHGWRLLVGAVVIVAATAGFGALYYASDTSTPVLVVAQPVAAGQVITAADLQTADVRAGAGVDAMPADQAGGVVGRAAAVPLVPGSVLSAGQVGPPAFPASGEAVVAVSVGLPPAGLTAGSRVLVLVTPSSPGGEVLPAALLPATAATVVAVGEPDGTGGQAVSLLVPAGVGEQVAAAAAAGTVSLVLTAVN